MHFLTKPSPLENAVTRAPSSDAHVVTPTKVFPNRMSQYALWSPNANIMSEPVKYALFILYQTIHTLSCVSFRFLRCRNDISTNSLRALLKKQNNNVLSFPILNIEYIACGNVIQIEALCFRICSLCYYHSQNWTARETLRCYWEGNSKIIYTVVFRSRINMSMIY